MKNRNVKGLPKDEIPLDEYEWEIKEFLDKGKFDFMTKKQFDKHKLRLQEAARHYLARKSITVRVKKRSLAKFKVRAKNSGVPYQTIINAFIDQYGNNQIKLAI